MNRGSREEQWKVDVGSRQHKHNLNRNYNLMGFDTIEINLFPEIDVKCQECKFLFFKDV